VFGNNGDRPESKKGALGVREKNQEAAASQGQLEELVRVSREIGENPEYVLWGGGNSSLKGTEIDFRGLPVPVLRIKSTGADLKTVTVQDFVGLRLDDVLALRERNTMSDEEMRSYLAHCAVNPDGPHSSIEALLHAFLPFPAVIHSHADVILALVDTPDPAEAVRAALGNRVVIVPYLRPGFAMAKEASQAARAMPQAEAMVLVNHGLVTWGDTPEEAYRAHLDMIARAEQFLGKRTSLEVDRRQRWPQEIREELAQRLAPLIRRCLASPVPCVLRFGDDERLLRFTERHDLEVISQIGAATPDHILHTKNTPLILPCRPEMTDAELAELVQSRALGFRAGYRSYFERHNNEQFRMRSPDPVVVLVPGVGVWAAGATALYARIPLDVYSHTVAVMEMAEKTGGYRSLPEAEAFEAEYWPLELYKMTLRPDPPELQGKIAMVTGAASGIGAAIAKRLAQAGAAVVLADRDRVRLQQTREALADEFGSDQVCEAVMDVADKDQVAQGFKTAVRAYGGLDILVSNAGTALTGELIDLGLTEWEASLRINITGHFLATQQALRIMKRQGLGGNIVFIVSKNAFVPGRGFGAYSVAKAAELQLGRIAAIEHAGDGIRVNMINPDAIWTGLWSPEVRASRSQAYNIPEEELEDYYRRRSLLQRTVTAEDVAEAVLFFVSERAGKTTGAVLPVDSGIREGFPR
jgi:rhamnulose-1-phosphate aldolase/alcohol dehydrogenase